ncbi:unnamed protein product [Spirodela intermedia]|uniref:RING-CH-type domain-containing protein n=1 Tax=Spirodela intermedia TaxID=51605 RepID=A0A7I8JTP7_SPIIN|nr:unnamed protein product [Spirodela intermedia]CAA6673131.1 unnamed protein product [Spirodela intermedia]
MGGHFVLLVDRLLTESSLAAAIQSGSQPMIPGPMVAGGIVQRREPDCFPQKRNLDDEMQALKMSECRICQEEDLEFNMEVPCSCSGSLKYAHRKCIQRWCDEKGDTVCEICLQQFKPDYTAPPKLLHYGSMPMAFRGNWGVSRQSLHSPHFIPVVAADQDFVGTDYDDYPTSNTRSIIFCRSVAVILTVLLVVSHTLPIIMSFGGEWWYSIAEFLLFVVKTAGILLPVIIMARALFILHRRHCQQQCGCALHGPPPPPPPYLFSKLF